MCYDLIHQNMADFRSLRTSSKRIHREGGGYYDYIYDAQQYLFGSLFLQNNQFINEPASSATSPHYTTNPHERSASNGHRAPAKRPPSDFARQVLGGCSPSARQTTCSAIARRALLGISGQRVTQCACTCICNRYLGHCKIRSLELNPITKYTNPAYRYVHNGLSQNYYYKRKSFKKYEQTKISISKCMIIILFNCIVHGTVIHKNP